MAIRPGLISLEKLINENGVKNYVEIGVFKASFAILLLGAGINLDQYFLVDPWPYEFVQGKVGRGFTEKSWDSLHRHACSLSVKHKPIKVLRLTSKDASTLFDNKSVDMVFIDGNHFTESVIEDIGLWEPKIRLGGIISGHDAEGRWSPHVKEALRICYDNEFEVLSGGIWWRKIE